MMVLFIFANGTGRHYLRNPLLAVINFRPVAGFRLFPLLTLANFAWILYHLFQMHHWMQFQEGQSTDEFHRIKASAKIKNEKEINKNYRGVMMHSCSILLIFQVTYVAMSYAKYHNTKELTMQAINKDGNVTKEDSKVAEEKLKKIQAAWF